MANLGAAVSSATNIIFSSDNSKADAGSMHKEIKTISRESVKGICDIVILMIFFYLIYPIYTISHPSQTIDLC